MNVSKYPLMAILLIAPMKAAHSEDPSDFNDASEEGGIRITDIIETGVKGIPGCIDYCVVGICTHIVIELLDIEIIISPKVQHNTQEFLVSAYRAQHQQPWEEWREVFGSVQADVADGIFGVLSSEGRVGGYGTYTEEHQENDRQAPYKEVDIIGHPLSLLPTLFNNGEITSTAPSALQDAIEVENAPVDGNSSDSDSDSDAEDSIGEWLCRHNDFPWCDDDVQGNGDEDKPIDEEYKEANEAASQEVDTNGFPAVFMNPEILDVFSYQDTISKIGESVNDVSEALDYLSQMQNAIQTDSFGIGVSFGGASILCPNSVLPFTPYYLSALDTISWRLPWADVLTHYDGIGLAMIPLISDRPVIGTPNGFTDTPGLGDGTWGALYPRTGFVRNEHDGKVGSVVAQRAIDLVLANKGADHTGYVGAIFDPGFPTSEDYRHIPYVYHASGIEGGVWQPIFPMPSYSCTNTLYKPKTTSDISDDKSAPKSVDQRYMWAFWRRYECCLSRRGEFLLDVDFDPLCIDGLELSDPNKSYEE